MKDYTEKAKLDYLKSCSQIKVKYPDMIFTGTEWLFTKQIEKLEARLLDVEKILENIKNELNIK